MREKFESSSNEADKINNEICFDQLSLWLTNFSYCPMELMRSLEPKNI